MSGITDLRPTAVSIQPKLSDGEFVFCTVEGDLQNYTELKPLKFYRS